MNAAQIQAIKQGDLGLYEWDKSLPVVKVHPVLDILIGPKKGFLFRYVEVLSSTGNATIGFIVEQSESTIEACHARLRTLHTTNKGGQTLAFILRLESEIIEARAALYAAKAQVQS